MDIESKQTKKNDRTEIVEVIADETHLLGDRNEYRNSIATTHDEIRERIGELEHKLTIKGRRILGERCVEENLLDENGDILIFLPEELLDPNIFVDTHQWFHVLLVGEDCKYLTQDIVDNNNVFMRWALFGDRIYDIGDSLWIVDEQIIDDPVNCNLVCPAIYTN